ncbi:15586_t:CDS:2 [Racocetra persica]|uniref:15586_t:CDS:1 n=1 Tax=Racocetra persica TaxID=160502 RepID=A0ACA9KIS9_9GLOM|nr:15586_t:CDS:2 [Racocetra persica]
MKLEDIIFEENASAISKKNINTPFKEELHKKKITIKKKKQIEIPNQSRSTCLSYDFPSL